MIQNQESEFNNRSRKTAENIYISMLDNYDPVPEFLIENKSDILDFLIDAWTHGANWRYGDMYKKGLVKFY